MAPLEYQEQEEKERKKAEAAAAREAERAAKEASEPVSIILSVNGILPSSEPKNSTYHLSRNALGLLDGTIWKASFEHVERTNWTASDEIAGIDDCQSRREHPAPSSRAQRPNRR
jgi:hypothetical protein